MVAALRADLHNVWLHQGKADKNHPGIYSPSDFGAGANPQPISGHNGNGSAPVSHGQQPREQTLEERVRSGGRVASQSVENQKAIFASMLEAAKAPPSMLVYENKETGQVISKEEFDKLYA